ncbi:MAG: hypothetical protein IJW82_01680 [Clostridia bacterium]|nr:hypothetical protein [Clostridia bacterium]
MIYDVEELNRCFKDDPAQHVTKAEKKYKQQIKKCIEPLLKSHSQYKFVLLAGPSSAGKTTTSYLIKENLEINGYNAKVVSLDNFFVEREQTPVLPNGKKDYESINALDWKLFAEKMKELIENKKSQLPIYDFISGSKHLANEFTTLRDNEIIIIEGLHALNPIIDQYIPTKLAYKVYLNTESEFNYKGTMLVNKEEIKLVRRLIRDFKKRGATPSMTFNSWPEVLHGEEMYITPYKKYANYKIDTTHAY